jgi:hypothetical protein
MKGRGGVPADRRAAGAPRRPASAKASAARRSFSDGGSGAGQWGPRERPPSLGSQLGPSFGEASPEPTAEAGRREGSGDEVPRAKRSVCVY